MGQYLQDTYSNHDHMSLGWKIYLHRGHVGYKSQPIRSKTHVLNQGPKQKGPSNRSVVSLAVKTLFQMPTMHIGVPASKQVPDKANHGRSQRWLMDLNPYYSSQRFGLNSWLLALAGLVLPLQAFVEEELDGKPSLSCLSLSLSNA